MSNACLSFKDDDDDGLGGGEGAGQYPPASQIDLLLRPLVLHLVLVADSHRLMVAASSLLCMMVLGDHLGSMSSPGQSWLAFGCVLSRLQGGQQKSRETGAKPHGRDEQYILGGSLVITLTELFNFNHC